MCLTTVCCFLFQKEDRHNFFVFCKWELVGFFQQVGQETIGIFAFRPFTFANQEFFAVHTFGYNIEFDGFVARDASPPPTGYIIQITLDILTTYGLLT